MSYTKFNCYGWVVYIGPPFIITCTVSRNYVAKNHKAKNNCASSYTTFTKFSIFMERHNLKLNFFIHKYKKY